MASALMWVIKVVLIVVVFDYCHAQSLPTFLEINNSNYNSNIISKDVITVFESGNYKVTNPPIKVRKRQYSAPEPLIIVSPKEAGCYPVLLFIHGTMISNDDYSDLFYHIASHGFIVVAPQLFSIFYFPSQQDEIDMALSVANWLPSNLNQVLQQRVGEGIKGDFDKIAVSGHSRGGKTAFALTLGLTKKTKLSVKISALIGVDPVAGQSKTLRFEPYVLTYEPNSMDLRIPVTVIGTGKGNESKLIMPCAPNEVNHQQFFDEIKEGSHFVIMEYGHMDMLNDLVFDIIPISMCKSGDGPKRIMRSTVGGIMVAFLDAYFGEEGEQYFAIMANPSLAPTEIFVENKGKFEFASTNAQA